MKFAIALALCVGVLSMDQGPIRLRLGIPVEAPPSGTTITWTTPSQTGSVPGANGFLSERYDPVSGQILHYGILSGSATIYSTNMFAWNAATNVWTELGGNDNLSNDCSETFPPWPSNRHPGQQLAVDTARSRMYLLHGVCNPEDRLDMYYYSLNSDPTTNTWTQLTPTTNPNVGSGGFPAIAAMDYSALDDVVFLYGYDGGSSNHNNWVYCPGASLSAEQIAAGCDTAADWQEMPITCCAIPPGVTFASMISIGNHKMFSFGGANPANSVWYNETWLYDIPTKAWTEVCTGGCSPPPVYDGPAGPPTWSMVYVASENKVLYHQNTGTGAPRDWEYDIDTDAWSVITTVGTGPTGESVTAYDPVNGVMILYTHVGGVVTIYKGVVTF